MRRWRLSSAYMRIGGVRCRTNWSRSLCARQLKPSAAVRDYMLFAAITPTRLICGDVEWRGSNEGRRGREILRVWPSSVCARKRLSPQRAVWCDGDRGVSGTASDVGGTVKNQWREAKSINQSMNQSKSLINSCQTATEHIHMNCTNKNNDKMQ